MPIRISRQYSFTDIIDPIYGRKFNTKKATQCSEDLKQFARLTQLTHLNDRVTLRVEMLSHEGFE